MPYVSGLLRDEKVTNDEGAIGHVDKVSRQKQKSPDPQAAGQWRAAAAFRAHLNLYVEKLDVLHCNYADALPAILVNNTVALNRYILGWLITHSLT